MTRPSRRTVTAAPAASAACRLARSAMFSAVNTALGWGAHHLATADTPHWTRTATIMAVLFVLALAAPTIRRSWTITVPACAAAQLAVHVWLGAGALHNAFGHHAPTAVTGAGGPLSHDAWHHRLHRSAAMTLTHATAAVAVALLLHHADTALWQLNRRIACAAHTVTALLALCRGPRYRAQPPAPPTYRSRRDKQDRLPQPETLTHVLVRRGPPHRFGLTA
jgi:hypothetical protein